MPLAELETFCNDIGFPLSEDQVKAFEGFRSTLYEFNAKFNLTRIAAEDCEQRHFLDSLLFIDRIDAGESLLDIGTGAGFPAWPIACARPDVAVTALDSSGKVFLMLDEVPLPNLELVKARAEEWDRRESYDWVTGRALAPLAIQLELSAAFAKVGGVILPFRTPNDYEEIKSVEPDALGLELEDVIERELPGSDIRRVFPVYRKVGKTSNAYPRHWAKIKANPIR